MARARFLRPEFFTDEKIGELPFGARLLFQAIWCHSDLRGVFEHSPKLLRTHAFPYDEKTTSVQVGEWLGLLESLGMVARFEASGKSWGCVCKWETHQKVSGREREIGSSRPHPPSARLAAENTGESHGDDTGTTRGRSGDDLGCTQVATPTPTPTPTPAITPTPTHTPAPPTRAPVSRESDLFNEAEKALVSHDQAWPYEKSADWAKELIWTGAKIGARNWTTWKALIDEFGAEKVKQTAKALPADERWPDQTEVRLRKQGSQAPSLNEATKHKTIKVVS